MITLKLEEGIYPFWMLLSRLCGSLKYSRAVLRLVQRLDSLILTTALLEGSVDLICRLIMLLLDYETYLGHFLPCLELPMSLQHPKPYTLNPTA